MQYAESQVSRTRNTFASDTPDILLEPSTTWDFSSSPPIITADEVGESARLAYRYVVLDSVIVPRLATERGADTLMLRFAGIDPTGRRPEDIGAELGRFNERLERAIGEVCAREAQANPPRPGRSLSLPVSEDDIEADHAHWQSRTLWIRVGLREIKRHRCTSSHARSRRVGVEHLPFILEAASSFCDHDTGHHCTASKASIAARVCELAQRARERGQRWRGRATWRLSRATLERAVGDVLADLTDIGLIIERARGRYLTAGERTLAWVRHKIHQIRAASVRDFVMPRRLWKHEARPTKPSWAYWQPPTPHTSSSTPNRRWLPALSPYLYVVRLPSSRMASLWLLSAFQRMSGQHPRAERAPQPSLRAKKTAAELAQALPWLLRPAGGRKRLHINALARIIEATGHAGACGRALIDALNFECANAGLEPQIDAITNPLGWLRTMLTHIERT